MTSRTILFSASLGFSLLSLGLVACDELELAPTKLVDAGADATIDASPDAPAGDAAPTVDGGGDAADGGINFGTCATALKGDAGTVFSKCDPVSAVPCDVANGGTCDLDPQAGTFKCYPAAPIANTLPICAACDLATNKGCQPGLTCSPDGICVRYCCENADCKGHGSCGLPGPFDFLPGVGICFDEAAACAVTDAGTDAPTDAPADG